MKAIIKKAKRRLKRKKRVRAKISGTAERPRLSVFRSLNHIYAQVIDDEGGRTLAAASTLSEDVTGKITDKKRTEAAGIVGEEIARLSIEKGIKQVAFDRNGMPYHGRVKALAEAARKAGLEF